MSIRIHFHSLLTYFKSHILQLNVFESGNRDESIIQGERRTTRLYLVALITSSMIIGFYYSIIQYKHTVVIESPSFDEYSRLSKDVSFECFCRRISIKYEEFVQIKPYYHELCESDFISDEYLNHLYVLYEQTWNKSVLTDFHRTGVFQFQTLRTFCQTIQKMIKNNLETFLQREFVQSQLVTSEVLQIEVTSLVTDFVYMIPKTFLRTLKFIQDTTAQNLLMTGASVTSVLPIYGQDPEYELTRPYIGMNYTFTDGSSCICSTSTAHKCMGLATFNNESISGFQTGCYMLNALLKSTLEIFYNQTFVNLLTNSSNKFQKLNSSVSNSTIETLLSQMFVTHWSNETSFEQYFNQCTPNSCQYTITQRNDFLFIITTFIGLFEGLSSVFQSIIPFLVMTIWPIVWKFITRRQRSNIRPVLSINDRLNIFSQSIKRKVIELNLFQSIPPSQDENILQQQRYTTRLYIILLLISVFILTTFTSIKPQTIVVKIKSPSLTDLIQLYEQYPLTLDCPCSETTIDMKFVTDIKAEYHEVCSSKFVSLDWINVHFIQTPTTKLYTHDFRYQSQFYFQILSTLCQMANQTIEDSLQSFYKTKFITYQAVSPQLFQTQINLIVEQFKRTVPESFQRTLQLIKTNYEINQFITSMNSEFDSFYDEDDSISHKFVFWGYERLDKSDCDGYFLGSECVCYSFSSYKCSRQIVIRENEMTIFIIPGMFQTWFPLHSLFISTLECFYNDTCFSQITQLINSTLSPTNFTTLKSSLLPLNISQYDPIQSLANNLFIHSWYNESSFESYFNRCQPLTCHYTYETRLNLIYIITMIIGFIGGVNVVLDLLLPYVVKSIIRIRNYVVQRQRDNINTVTQTISIRTRLCNYFRKLLIYSKRTIVELNLFSKNPPSTDPTIIRRNRHKTRIYLIILITAFLILIFYTSLREETITKIVKSPSVSEYTELYFKYSRTLQCSCSHIAMKYNKFITQIDVQYHQICSSVFISQKWLESMNYLYNGHKAESIGDDFRISIRLQFQTLSKLCELSQNMLNTSLLIFKQTDFITLHVISHAEFNIRTEAIIEQFKRTTVNQFIEIFKLIQIVNYANQLVSLYATNWKFTRKYPDNKQELKHPNPVHLLAVSQKYGDDNCTCGIQSNCSKLSDIPLYLNDNFLRETLPGFRVGCMFLDALLQSTFTCLYNETCLNLMQASIHYNKPYPAEPLTYSSSSMPNTTMETILSELFVSNWLKDISFDLYFNECAPHSCQYSYTMEYNPIYVATTLIALFGGLTSRLHLLVSFIALIVYKIVDYRKKKTQIAPILHQSNVCEIEQNNNSMNMTSVSTVTTTTDELNVNSIEEQRTLRTKRIERAVIICLCLLAIVAVVTVFVVLFIHRNNKQKSITFNTQTTLISTSNIMTESTSISTNICYMTLKYQSETYPTDSSPTSMITGDFNQDSIVDLVVTNFDSDTVSVMLGNGNGTFQRQKTYSTGYGSGPREVAAADLDNDTLLDLVISLSSTKDIVIFFGAPPEMIFYSTPYKLPNYTSDNIVTLIETGDLNDDGFVDLIFIYHPNRPTFSDNHRIFLNTGDGRQFSSSTIDLAVFMFEILSIVIADLDNDGRQNDLAFVDSENQVYICFSISLESSYFDPECLETSSAKMYEHPSKMINGRFNDDELDDLAFISSQSDTLQLLLSYRIPPNIRNINYNQLIYRTDNYPTSITRFNFNNDPIDDLAILSCNGTVSVFLGTKSGLFHRKYLTFGIDIDHNGTCCHSLKVADLNRDGRDDLVFIDATMNSARVIFGLPCDE